MLLKLTSISRLLPFKGKTCPYFAHPMMHPWADLAVKAKMNVQGQEYFISTTFRPPNGSVRKANYVFPYIYMH